MYNFNFDGLHLFKMRQFVSVPSNLFWGTDAALFWDATPTNMFWSS